MPSMTDEELAHFMNTVAAATYANKACAVLTAAGIAITRENAAQVYGKWLGEGRHFEQFVLAIDTHIAEIQSDIAMITEKTVGRA